MISFDYHFKVRYKDIDQMGVMYYSRYFEYYEAARTDMMRDLGLTYKELEHQGIMMPVVHSEADYYQGPGFDDHLTCITEVRVFPRGKMEIHYTLVQDENRQIILNRGKTVHAFVKMDGKPTRIPASLKHILENNWNSNEQ
ncbi:MAG: acyl-CoA thioesterase [Candidatus Marinimicrobia bacterium]|nr:acyl-CoA thioesterase [Candidatus Neomarinimicrobiota bacterium]